jgi:hypothetical protein
MGDVVHRLHDSQVIGQTIDRGVAVGGKAGQQVGVADGREMAQHLRKIGRADLAGSAGAVRE